MSFLAPLFALAALAVIGPIVFHLIRRTTREVTPFSTLMFLAPTPPRVTRRSRLENLWLLLLRCLAIALLALAFARPFLHSAATPAPLGPVKQIVILLDTSASLRREKLWDGAKRKAEEWLRKVTPADDVALLAFDREVRPLVSFEEWRKLKAGERVELAAQRLAGAAPGWSATHLDTALLHAAELLSSAANDAQAAREIVVVSDLQEGCRLDALQGYQWPRGLAVTFDPVRAGHLENASLQWLSDETDSGKTAEEAPLRVRVTNAAESKNEQFKLTWFGASSASPIDAYVPAGQSRSVRLPKPPSVAAPSLALAGDDTEFDNTTFLLPAQTTHLPVLFLGSDTDDDPRGSLYYLRRAFSKTSRQSVEIAAHRTELAVPAFQLQQAQLLVLGDGVADAALASARQFAMSGKIVLAPLTDSASALTLARLLGLAHFSATEPAVKDYALLAQIDFQHPLFASFADPRFSDFTKIHFWKYRRFDAAQFTGGHVVARFDSGDPAIVQVPLGRGSVVVFASSWRTTDSQLALSSKFVPLLHALLEQSSDLPAARAQYFVGDELPLGPDAQPLTIRKPDGTEITASGKFSATDQPGIYSVSPGTQRFVVNLAPEESRTSPLPLTRFASLGIPLQTPLAGSPAQLARRQEHAQAAELEARQKVWRWLVVAALGVLLLETLIAAKLSRTTPTPAPV